MNKKIINLDKHEDFIGLENVKDLYSILDYKPILIRTEFNGNYLEYGSEGSNSLSFMEYLNLIKPYLEDLINVRKHHDIKLVKTDKKRNKLVSEPNYHTMKIIDNNLAIIEMKKVRVRMNKPIYLGMSILDISKITM